jgi:hypothetical protein
VIDEQDTDSCLAATNSSGASSTTTEDAKLVLQQMDVIAGTVV